jgi:hypothetical protein
MAYYSDPSADAINRAQGQVQEVKSIMVENIEKASQGGGSSLEGSAPCRGGVQASLRRLQ